MNVRLHIERLVLEGIHLRHAGRGELQAAVEQELSRLIGEHGLSSLTQSNALAAVRAPQIELEPSSSNARTGAAIASAVYGGIGGGE